MDKLLGGLIVGYFLAWQVEQIRTGIREKRAANERYHARQVEHDRALAALEEVKALRMDAYVKGEPDCYRDIYLAAAERYNRAYRIVGTTATADELVRAGFAVYPPTNGA